MSLFGTIQMAGNTLQAMQIGLQVVGNNIANANTPGYVREQTLFAPAPVQKVGNLTLGLGVQVTGIVQTLDKFVETRLRDAGGDRASADVQDGVYRSLESILGELSDTDTSTALSNFFNSIDEVLKQPEENSVRNLAVQTGKTLTTSINSLQHRVQTVYQDFGTQVDNLTSEINTLTEQVRKLNLQIVSLEGGNSQSNEAGGLRSQRSAALQRLGEIANIKVTETAAGADNVQLGGEFLVFEGTRREVQTKFSSDKGLTTASINYADNGDALQVSSGELHGIYESRDTIVRGFLDRLDQFAGTLANQFNRVYSQGQGASGFTDVTSQDKVSDPNATLDAAGLKFTPTNGRFNIVVHNKATNLDNTTTISVDLNGLDGDSTLKSLAADIDAIAGVSAEVTSDNHLRIKADSGDTEIGFSGDTSGVLASLGVNTFFTGSTAGDIGINPELLADGSKFAASDDGKIGVGTGNAQKLIALHDTGIDGLGGDSITGTYDQLINETSQGATVASSALNGFQVFEQTLQASNQAVSGVNLDEEAVNLILLQRTYQASAKFIATVSDLLDTLIKL